MMIRNLGLLLCLVSAVNCGEPDPAPLVLPPNTDVGAHKDTLSIDALEADTAAEDALFSDVSAIDTALEDIAASDISSQDTTSLDTNPKDTGPTDTSADDASLADVPLDDSTGDEDTLPPEDTMPVSASARLVAPLSTAMSGSKTPHFRVALEGNVNGVTIEICQDLACTKILSSFGLEGREGWAPMELAPGVVYWRAAATLDGTTASEFTLPWQLRVGYGDTASKASFGSFFDANLDGYNDALVSACGLSTCTEKVYLYLGGPDGLSTTAEQALENPQMAKFGQAVSPAGDMNGDGYPEVIVGTMLGDSAVVFLGGPDGVNDVPAHTWAMGGAFFGFSVAPAGDVNGDGYGDVIVGAMLANSAFLYFGSADGPGLAPDFPLNCPGIGACGTAVAGGGDVNGDGYGDLVVGDGAGDKVYVWHGQSTGPNFEPDTILEGTGLFGTSIDIAGDVNGDGFADVIVGAPNENFTFIYFGSATGLSSDNKLTLPGGGENGISVAAAGDVNSDGLMDIVSGSKFMARIYLGDTDKGAQTTPIEILGETSAFADTVAGVGDTNGDGYADVLIGATDQDTAYLYFGNADGLSVFPDVTLIPSPSAPGFGFAVALNWVAKKIWM